jgi:hypothetical protein
MYVRRNPIEIEEVAYIEERCCHLDSFFNAVGGRHSFIIATTRNGRKVRFDYYCDHAEPVIRYDYHEIFASELFRMTAVPPGTSVQDVKDSYYKNSMEKPYHFSRHNCQHVARDTYNDFTDYFEIHLRNDFLAAVIDALPIHEREEFLKNDTMYKLMIDHVQPAIEDTIKKTGDRREALK